MSAQQEEQSASNAAQNPIRTLTIDYRQLRQMPLMTRKHEYAKLHTELEKKAKKKTAKITRFGEFCDKNGEIFENMTYQQWLQAGYPILTDIFEQHRSTQQKKQGALNTIGQSWSPAALILQIFFFEKKKATTC